jgi:uncharacterized glyoxalase superfamily protein PhnB
MMRWRGVLVSLVSEGRFPTRVLVEESVMASVSELAEHRILVPDVDRLWAMVQAVGFAEERPIADRSYGVRDFTVRDPDGFGLRFASPLAANR